MQIRNGLLRNRSLRWRGMGLRPTMITAFGVPVLFVVTLMIYVQLFGMPFAGFKGEISELRSDTLNHLNLVADLKVEMLEHWLKERRSDATALVEEDGFQQDVHELLLTIRQMDTSGDLGRSELVSLWQASEIYQRQAQRVEQRLALIRDAYGVYESIVIIDAHTGLFVVSTDPDVLGLREKNGAHFQAIVEPASTGEFMHVMQDEHDSLPSPELVITRQITAPGSDTTDGVLMLRVEFEEIITPIILTNGALGLTDEALLIGNDNKILSSLAHPLADGSIAEPLKYEIGTEAAMSAAAGLNGTTSSTDYRGVKVLAAYRYIELSPSLGWGLVVKQDESEFSIICVRV